MNILFLSQRIPFPPNKGDKLRSFNEIKYLSRKHKISLVCLTDNSADMKYAADLREYCDSVDIVFLPRLKSKMQSVGALFSSHPLTRSYFYAKDLQAIVDCKLSNETYDAIFVYCSSMAQYVEQVTDIPKIIDFVDVDSEKWRQYSSYARFPLKHLYRLESRRLRRYEAWLAKTFQHCIFVSKKEADDFGNLVCSCPTVTPIPNGVDGDLFQPSPAPYAPHALVFTGAMDYFANVEAVLFFVREILPLIRQSLPQVTLTVVGSNPAAEIQALPKTDPAVFVTGSVGSVQPYVVNSAVFVAPMRIARGVQNKILEAMAMGVPVVTTPLGFEGISAAPGKDLFVEDLPERFAQRVIELMLDRRLRKAVSESSRTAVESHYDWPQNLEKLEHILAETTSGRKIRYAPEQTFQGAAAASRI
jgi:polysaccharide biosynthesis protein PslH